MFKKILSQADEIITISNFTKKKLLLAGAQESKIKIIEPKAHITPNNFKVTDKEIKKFKDKYNLNNKKIILTVGRLVSRKGQDMVIKGISQIPEAIYLIVGDGPDKERLAKLAKDNEVSQRVFFTGRLNDQETAISYAVCDLFIMLSREEGDDFEGYGIVFKEAQSFHKPVIAGRSGGTIDAIGSNGILVDPNNLEEVVKVIMNCLT